MLKDMAPKANTGAVPRARRLRRAMTLPEILLWRALRTRPGGLKFRRQHPCGVCVLDFYCSDARLAIEVDGKMHARGAHPARDAVRDARLAVAGVATTRIAARDVLADLDAAVAGIVAAAQARLPLHHPAARDGPPPRA